MAKMILSTLNAKYIHASLGLRYLLANMARYGGEDLRAQSVLREFTIGKATEEIAQLLLDELDCATRPHPHPDPLLEGEGENPRSESIQIVGFGVYIWNVTATTEVVRHLKRFERDD